MARQIRSNAALDFVSVIKALPPSHFGREDILYYTSLKNKVAVYFVIPDHYQNNQFRRDVTLPYNG
jgi:hypothetical protein